MSFHDPSGYVFEANNQIYRVVRQCAALEFQSFWNHSLRTALVATGRLVDTSMVPRSAWHELALPCEEDVFAVLTHARIPVWTYPYEWSFAQLKRAALFHLDLHRCLLDSDFTLSDATPYNVQFVGPQPIFIDWLSVRRYRDGELWAAHRQFCELFLFPLLLAAFVGIEFQPWLSGAPAGIRGTQVLRALPKWRRLSWRSLKHVVIPAWFDRRPRLLSDASLERIRSQRLPRKQLIGLLEELRDWIEKLALHSGLSSVWSDYECQEGGSARATEAKKALVERFCKQQRRELLLDVGCNRGNYALAALDAGAKGVIGWDIDEPALCTAFSRASERSAAFLPLHVDAVNPSPASGWLGEERTAIVHRVRPDAVLLLATLHHMVIARNVGLDMVIDWLLRLAPTGLVEFVPKEDQFVRRMLALREDVFHDYTEDVFVALLKQRTKIIACETIPGTARTIYWYEA